MRKLSAAEFLELFPQVNYNDNLLMDIACPECGNRDCFDVAISTRISITDQGVDEQTGDNEYDGDSSAFCVDCQAAGVLEDFTIPGLDELLQEQTDVAP